MIIGDPVLPVVPVVMSNRNGIDRLKLAKATGNPKSKITSDFVDSLDDCAIVRVNPRVSDFSGCPVEAALLKALTSSCTTLHRYIDTKPKRARSADRNPW